MQIIGDHQKILFIDDFAQNASRIQAAIDALKNNYPKSKIKAFYEAHASFIQHPDSLNELKNSFKDCQEIVIYRLNFSQKNSHRLSAQDFQKTISHSLYLPLPELVLDHYKNTLKPGDILVHFSSGGLEGQKIFKKIINSYSQ